MDAAKNGGNLSEDIGRSRHSWGIIGLGHLIQFVSGLKHAGRV
jgi:hypothetical protein